MSISEGIALVLAQYRGAVEDEPFSSEFSPLESSGGDG